MARNYRYNSRYNGGNNGGKNRNGGKKKKSKYTEVEKFAFQLGRATVGCENPDSRVRESYENGMKSTQPKEKKTQKPLF